MIFSYIIDQIYQNISPIFIGKYYSTAQLGQYNRAEGYANLPSRQFTGMIQGVTFPVLSQLIGDKERLKEKYRTMIKVTAFVITPIMLGLSALASPFVLILIGEKWAPCIIFLQIICFTRSIYPIQSLNVNLLMVSGRSDLYLRLEIIKKVVGVLMLAITLPISVLALVWGYLIYSILCLFLNLHYSKRIVDMTTFSQIRDVLPSWLLSLLMYLCVCGYTKITDNLYAQLIGGIVIGIAVYLSGAYLFRFKEINEVKYMLNRKK